MVGEKKITTHAFALPHTDTNTHTQTHTYTELAYACVPCTNLGQCARNKWFSWLKRVDRMVLHAVRSGAARGRRITMGPGKMRVNTPHTAQLFELTQLYELRFHRHIIHGHLPLWNDIKYAQSVQQQRHLSYEATATAGSAVNKHNYIVMTIIIWALRARMLPRFG